MTSLLYELLCKSGFYFHYFATEPINIIVNIFERHEKTVMGTASPLKLHKHVLPGKYWNFNKNSSLLSYIKLSAK